MSSILSTVKFLSLKHLMDVPSSTEFISTTSDFPNITFITYVESWSESKFVPKTSKTAHRLENLYVVSPLTGSLPH